MKPVTVNMDNLTDPEREQLMALMEKANKTKWAGPSGDWNILGDGDVRNDLVGRLLLHRYHATGHCGETEKQAEFIRDQLTNYAWMLHAWLEVVGDWRPDIHDKNQTKYVYAVDEKSARGATTTFKEPHLFYFQTKEDCLRWVDMVGDKIKAQVEK